MKRTILYLSLSTLLFSCNNLSIKSKNKLGKHVIIDKDTFQIINVFPFDRSIKLSNGEYVNYDYPTIEKDKN